MADNKVEIEVKANVTGEESVGALGRSLDSTGSAAKKLGTDAGSAASGVGSADTAAKGFTTTSGKLRDGLESVSTQLSNAKTELMALVGVGAGLQGIKDIADLADSYKNLASRVKLVTGEGPAFEAAFDGIVAVAKRTSSNLESTGNLFAKLADAGKAMGIGQGEALALTETVNQAIQLSGASASASDAAITQLIQGLQGGVLRGDEFNSVMEQSPRLAKAMADGLGVTTGELRKMANEGKLSSDVVIKALQAQSDTIGTEFGKLPATVGRAMTNLSTAFTVYVGEADKAGGYTAKLAGVIDTLAGNLGTVATVMLHAGETFAALKILGMAQNWATASAAIQTTTTATAANTAATVTNTTTKATNAAAVVENDLAFKLLARDVALQTAALAGNTTATAGNSASQIAASLAVGKTGSAATGTATALGAVTGAVGGLMRAFAPLLALDIALNFKQYGTAIGEWAAKMLGAKDRSEELATADKAATQAAEASTLARKQQAAATQEAADRSFGLSKEASTLVGKFDEMRTKGDSAAEAIGKIGKDFDLSSIPGIRDAASVLDKLSADGKLSAKEVQQAWSTALKGVDLATFTTQATAAFKGTAREAERTAQVLDATLRESIKRTGLDFDVISGGMSKASISALNDTDTMIDGLDRLKAMGVDTAAALTASIGKGINTADTQKALEAVRLQIEAVRKVLGDKIADGLLDQAKQKALELKDAIDKATPGINSLREAYKELGLKTAEELGNIASTHKAAWEEIRKDGTASADTLQKAFTTYANSAIAASGNVGSYQRRVTEEILKTQAAAKGLEVSFDATGKIIVRTQAEAKTALEKTTTAMGQQRQAVDNTTTALERQNAAQERVNAATERAIDLENKRRGVDKEGFSTDKTGNRIAAGGDLTTLTGIAGFLKSAGVSDDATARSMAREFADPQGNIPYMNNPGQRKYGGDTISMALQKAAETYTFGSGNSGTGKQPSAIPDTAKTYTVNVQLAGRTTSINTASDSDAQRLQGLIDQLARAKGSA